MVWTESAGKGIFMNKTSRIAVRTVVVLAVGLFSNPAFAVTNNVARTFTSWPSEWMVMSGMNDVDNGLNEAVDFVGSSASPGGYYSKGADYVFFRQRLDIGSAPAGTFHDAHMILIDVVGSQFDTTSKTLQTGGDTGKPDYGFAWDSKSNSDTSHGLEMMIPSTLGSYWSDLRMADIDGDSGKKGVNDINGSGRTTDGYVRTIDSISTSDFGTTTFIDFAVSWSYLSAYTGLNSNQTWRIAFASIENATDHNAINSDVGSGASPSSLLTQGFAPMSQVPEPGAFPSLMLAGGLLWLRSRIHAVRVPRRSHR